MSTIVLDCEHGFPFGSAITQLTLTGGFEAHNGYLTGTCFQGSNSNLNYLGGNIPVTDPCLNSTFQVPGLVGSSVASSSTISLSVNAWGVQHVTGTTPIATINTPPNFPNGGGVYLIADGATPDTNAWLVSTGGNVAGACQSLVGHSYLFLYDGGTSLWYPPKC